MDDCALIFTTDTQLSQLPCIDIHWHMLLPTEISDYKSVYDTDSPTGYLYIDLCYYLIMAEYVIKL